MTARSVSFLSQPFLFLSVLLLLLFPATVSAQDRPVSSTAATFGSCLYNGINPFKGGGPAFPPENGFDGPSNERILMPGETIDRYGKPTGQFASPQGTPFSDRGLPRASFKNYNVYTVTSPVTVQSGRIAGSFWIGSQGGGIQYYFEHPLQNYINNGYLQPKY